VPFENHILSRQEGFLTKGRQNQKHRTREALLDAAMKLARDGHSPSIAEMAEAARVSIATAYRYFPNPQSLWADMATRTGIPGYPDFLEQLPDDAEAAIDVVVREVARFQFADEALWRGVLRATLDRWFSQLDLPEDERVPVRGITRLEMARRALEPLRDTLPPKLLERLTNAVVLVFGLESMVTTRDTCGLDPDEATEVMRWAAQALIRAALQEP
jgi:AcrR family transcriptional regulator